MNACSYVLLMLPVFRIQLFIPGFGIYAVIQQQLVAIYSDSSIDVITPFVLYKCMLPVLIFSNCSCSLRVGVRAFRMGGKGLGSVFIFFSCFWFGFGLVISGGYVSVL